MGRRRAVAAVSSDVDSSPSSVESSFREMDDVFLQTQTRIWLGEVLKTRLDKQLHISDLLADGELLFEVSKLLWNMLLGRCVELRHVKAFQCSVGSRKSSGKYMPYSNVDSFLRICKILGLNGIDLFSPSDVVEKRDIRKVCICIRALSNKARSKQLNVPDFDVVSYTVSMPTEMVGCIRRSLESSQCSFSSSSSNSSCKDTTSKQQQKNLNSECDGNCDSSSDEAESKYFGIETFCSSLSKFDDPVTLDTHTGDSPEAFSAVKQYTTRKSASQSHTRKSSKTNLRNGEQLSPSLLQMKNSLSLSQYRNEHHTNNLSSCHIKPQLNLHTDQANSYGNAMGLTDVHCALRIEASSSENSLFDSMLESDFISDYLAFSDSVVLGTNGNSPVFFDGEDNICNFFTGFDSHQSDMNQRTFQKGFHQKSSDDTEDVEVSSCTSMSSILGRVLNMDFDDQFDVGDSSMVKVHSCGFLEHEDDSQDRGSIAEDQPQDIAQFDTLSHISDSDVIESQYEMKLENVGFCHDFLSTCQVQGQSCSMKSQKLEQYGSFQKHPGDTYSLKDANLARSENDKEIAVSQNVEKEGIDNAISKFYPDSIQRANNHVLVDSLHYETFGESSIWSNNYSVERKENSSCNLQYQDAEILDVSCEISHKPSDVILANRDFISLANECEFTAEQQTNFFAKGSGDTNEACREASTDCHKKEGRTPENQEILSENVLDGRRDPNAEVRKDKLRGPLLKTVATGTALAGALFILLHISRRGRERADEPSQQLIQTHNFSGAKSSSDKRQSRKSDGTYPADKLKFGK